MSEIPSAHPSVFELHCWKDDNFHPSDAIQRATVQKLNCILYIKETPKYRSFRELGTAYQDLFDIYKIYHNHAWLISKTNISGHILSTIGYVINLAAKQKGDIVAITGRLTEFSESEHDSKVFDKLIADCSALSQALKTEVNQFWTTVRDMYKRFTEENGLFDWVTSHFGQIVTYALTIGGVGLVLSKEYLPPRIGSLLPASAIWPAILTIPSASYGLLSLLVRLETAVAAVYREAYMYTTARIEVAGLLSGLRGNMASSDSDSMPRIRLAIRDINKFLTIFSSGLEDLCTTQDKFSDNIRVWSTLPSYPLLQSPAAQQPPPHSSTTAPPTGHCPPSRPASVNTVRPTDDQTGRIAGPSGEENRHSFDESDETSLLLPSDPAIILSDSPR
ncbi:hypothetical protein ARMSODRAFT_966880 [Armillaria solidipes]|uniref:Uncharacterized protein n=1 Tax=Armillaria solidipes TaxID=1076256 RepID=A0A2H3AKS4_9AGAR|nr:hypothetical protein ARMSODRAFT_966880 [Armillaria solidipes]